MVNKTLIKCLCIFFGVVLYLAGLLLIGGGAYMIYTEKNTNGPGCRFSSPLLFARKGMTSLSQGNSFNAIMSAVDSNYGVELDVLRTADKEIVVFEQDNAGELTGENINIPSSSYQDKVKFLNYKSTLNGYNYASRVPVALFSEVVNQACAKNNEVHLDINIKGFLEREYQEKIMKVLDQSPCSCNNNQKIILTSDHFYAMTDLRRTIEDSRCRNTKIGLIVEPNTHPMGEEIWLKTKFMIYIGKPDIVKAHFKLFYEHRAILEGIRIKGFCTAVYGNYQNELIKYTDIDYRVVDTSAATYRDIDYQPNPHPYGAMIFAFIVGFLIVIGLSVFLCYETRKEWVRRKSGMTRISNSEN